jgi:signal transduction histidine kinase
MKLSLSAKVFLSVFLSSTVMLTLLGVILYRVQKEELQNNFQAKHEAIAKVLSNNLKQSETLTDQIMLNAAYAINDEVSKDVPTKKELIRLRDKYRVTELYVIGKSGRYLESTDSFAQDSNFNFYSFCQDYKRLTLKGNAFNQTPILLAYPPNNTKPYKFTQMSTGNKKRIIEVGMHLNFIEDILKTSLGNYGSIQSLTLKTPAGNVLGKISADVNAKQSSLMSTSIRVPANSVHCCQCNVKKLTSGDYFYTLDIQFTNTELKAETKHLLSLIVITEMFLLILSFLLARTISRIILTRLQNLSATVDNITQSGELVYAGTSIGNDEIDILSRNFNKMIENLTSKEKAIKESEKFKATFEIANQVAHDIRSPLAALEMGLSAASEMKEEHRIILRNAVNRVRDIANELARKEEKLVTPGLTTQAFSKEPKGTFLLGTLVESIVTEKRLQYRDRLKSKINFNQNETTYGIFVNLQQSEFKRVLSNLINNAVESLNRVDGGAININLYEVNESAVVVIADTGCGIPEEILPLIGSSGVSFGKEEGSGLGFAHAKTTIEALGGNVSISSKMNHGTTVEITLPTSKAPEWFVATLGLKPGQKVIVVDDDSTIHDLFSQRLGNRIQKSFTSLAEFKKYYGQNFIDLEETLILMDLEHFGSSQSGLDVIKELSIASQSILVTSHFENHDVVATCLSLGIRMIPKPMSGFVPITNESLVG